MTETERNPHAEPRASGSGCSRSRALQSHPIPALSPSPAPAAATAEPSLPPSPACFLGQDGGDNARGLFLLLPGAGGIAARMLSPLGHAAELMSRHSLRNERRLALAGSPGLGAAALSKELIFPGTFSPNKAVFGTDDTSQPRTPRPAAGERGQRPERWEKGSSAPFFLALPAASACFSKFLDPLGMGRTGGEGEENAAVLPSQRAGGALSPSPLIPGSPRTPGCPRGTFPPLPDHS